MRKPEKKTRRSDGTRTESGLVALLRPTPQAAVVLLALVAFLVYANSLAGEFVFDDTVIVQGNEAIQGLGLTNLKAIFGGHYWQAVKSQGGLYRPIVMLTYAVNYVLGGEDPEGYHLLNVLLHAASGIVIFFVLEAIFCCRELSFLSALFFVLHPIRTEGVASVVGRAESLSAFFQLAAWWAYVRGRKAREGLWYWLSGVGFLLACLSKESALAFIALLPLTDHLLDRERLHQPFELRATILRYSPHVAALALTFGLRYRVLGGLTPLYINPGSNPLIEADAWSRFLTATHVFGRYLGLLVFPRQLSADYSFNQIPVVGDIFSWRALLPLVLLVLLVAGMVVSFRRSPVFLFCSYLFLSSFLLTSNWIRPIGTIMAERLMYFPAIGFNCAVAFVLCRAFGLPRWRRVGGIVIAALLAGYALRTMDRNLDWRNHDALFRRAAETSPNSALVQSNYALVLLNQKNDARGAAEHARRALEIQPDDPSASYTLGRAYRRLGDLSRAAAALESVVRLAPRTTGGTAALRELAEIHMSTGQLDKARVDYERLIEWRPSETDAYMALSRVYVAMGKMDLAKEILDRLARVVSNKNR